MTATLNSADAPATAARSPRPLLSREERVRDIQWLVRRVNDYAEFVCRVDGLRGTSAEAKETAIANFHERLAILERQLGQIHEKLLLG